MRINRITVSVATMREILVLIDLITISNGKGLSEGLDQDGNLLSISVSPDVHGLSRTRIQKGKCIVVVDERMYGNDARKIIWIGYDTKVFSVGTQCEKAMKTSLAAAIMNYENPPILTISEAEQMKKGTRVCVIATIEQVYETDVAADQSWKSKTVRISDSTGKIKLKLWNVYADVTIERGQCVKFNCIEVHVYQEVTSLQTTKNSKIQVEPHELAQSTVSCEAQSTISQQPDQSPGSRQVGQSSVSRQVDPRRPQHRNGNQRYMPY